MNEFRQPDRLPRPLQRVASRRQWHAWAALALTFVLGLPGVARAAPQAAEPAAGELQLAWLDGDGQVQAVIVRADGSSVASRADRFDATASVPLGSLWKLIAFARLTDAQSDESPYRCAARDPQDVYCCEAGAPIDRATALRRSCGPYFAPARLGDAAQARSETLDALPISLHLLADPAHWRSDTRIRLQDWLQWLAAWPTATRRAASDALQPWWIDGPGQSVLSLVGTRLRVKTFTVERLEPGATGQRWAGASGWTSDGTPFWMAARGASARVVPVWASRALAVIDRHDDRRGRPSSNDIGSAGPCVDVDFFSRYPIQALRPAAPAQGRLDGRYTVSFVNGQQLPIDSRRELIWHAANDAERAAAVDLPSSATISGRFTLDDYVARVIDREGSARPAAAARALAVAARTYVLAHGEARDGCLRIADSSATQRVSPRAPSNAALAAARLTSGLVLDGAIGQYRLADAPPQVMSWQRSVRSAELGAGFDAILRDAYPSASLATLGGNGARHCEALPTAQRWLDRQRAAWHRQLSGEAGYQRPASIQVCRLQAGRPHAVRDLQRVYVTGSQSLEQRAALAHEYLHLAFSAHPRGNDEGFVEARARRLLGID